MTKAFNPTFTPANDAAYAVLNNLYLQIQTRKKNMSLRVRLELENLLNNAYPSTEEAMRDWWMREFAKLPGYYNF
ncbi:MAG: hypothetical protein WC341_00555 [Bacteroidales bacterium]